MTAADAHPRGIAFQAMSSTPDTPDRPGLPPLKHVLLVLLTCAVVYWPRLGATGLSSTEGHRVIPGWNMLSSGEWFLPRMFGQIYLRKPPGMSWAVAATGALFGESEWSARAVSALSATAMALVSTIFGARWFGRRFGLAAGLASALAPGFWSAGRSAEIEALNNFASAAAVLFVLDLGLRPGSQKRSGILLELVLAGAAIALAALAKGPAGFAAIGAAAIVALILSKPGRPRAGHAPATADRSTDQPTEAVSTRRFALARIGLASLVAALVLAPLAALIARAVHFSGESPITQDVSEFLWQSNERSLLGFARVAATPIIAIASAFPASLALLFPWGPDAKSESDAFPSRGLRLARAIAFTCVGSLALLLILGVHNPRYAMPSCVFLPVLVSYMARGWAGAFVPMRRRIAHWLFLGHPSRWPALLLAGAVLFIAGIEPRQRATSGRDAGLALAPSLPDQSMVWADHMVEARPEVLLYAQRAAGAQGRAIRIAWLPGMAERLSLPRPGAFLLLRTDDESNEAAAYERAGFMDRLRPIATGRVHKYAFTLYEMTMPRP